MDYITSNTGPTKTAVTNGVDGLMEADKYGNLVPSVAEDWSVSQDGLTYTYKIRKGVNGILLMVKSTPMLLLRTL